MSLLFRKTFRPSRRTRITVGTGGVSSSLRLGPFSITSKGHVTMRLFPGLTWRIF